MTDLDVLRRALRAGDEPAIHADLDVSSIMTRGRRMRRRRRLTAASGAVGVAGVALAVALGTTHPARPSFAPGQLPAAPGHIASPATAHATGTPVPRSATAPVARPTASPPPTATPTTNHTAFGTSTPTPTAIPSITPTPAPRTTSAVG